MAPNISSKPVCSQIGQEFCQVWATEKEGMLGAAETDLWDEAVLRTAARAFRAWRHAVAQVGGRLTTFLQVTNSFFLQSCRRLISFDNISNNDHIATALHFMAGARASALLRRHSTWQRRAKTEHWIQWRMLAGECQ